MRNRRRANSEINITPLIDILLVLMVIFMVVTPITPKGLETAIPQSPPPGPTEPVAETIVLSL
jgi:biopolymer transport protein ExbD